MLAAVYRFGGKRVWEWDNDMFATIRAAPENEQSSMRRLLMGGRLDDGNITMALELGLVDMGSPQNAAFIEEIFGKVSQQTNSENNVWGASVFELSNPLLPRDIVVKLMDLSTTTHAANAALCANPNCPFAFNAGKNRAEESVYLAALCKHGRFDDPDTYSKLLTGIISCDATIKPTVVKFLAERKELPAAMAALLDETVSNVDYERLSLTDGHKTFVEGVSLSDFDPSKIVHLGMLRLSPVLSREKILAIWDANSGFHAGRALREMGRLAVHPNAPEGLVFEMLSDKKITPELMAVIAVQAQWPRAEGLVRRAADDGAKDAVRDIHRIRAASPESLVWALGEFMDAGSDKDEEIANVVAHPNFPWKAFNLKKVLGEVKSDRHFEIAAAFCLSGGTPPDELGEYSALT